MKSIPSLSMLARCLMTAAVVLMPRLLSAAPLPNAWQITDNSTDSGSVLYYTNILSLADHLAATNHGFRFSVQARFVNSFNGSKTMNMIYGMGARRFQVWWYLDANRDLIAEIESGDTYRLTTNGTGTDLLHTHEIVFDPSSQTASYLVDGELQAGNLSPVAAAWPVGAVHWGAGASAGKAQMNFHRVSFVITNRAVAVYDAGLAGNPPTAPAPAPAEWGRYRATPLAGTGVTNVSPDMVPLSAAPDATTLSATGVQPYQAKVSAGINPRGLSTAYWFEWGTTTTYGNPTPIRRLMSGAPNTTVTETITGLSKGIAYHFRCVASNYLGVTYGQRVTFLTPQNFSVASLANTGYGSLRQSLADARSGDIIYITTNGTITLTTGELLITNDLTIAGPGPESVAVSGNNSSRVFHIGAGVVASMEGITIRNGRTASGAAGMARGESGQPGAGIFNEGTLSLSNCVISHNVTGAGGNGLARELREGARGGPGGNGAGIYNDGGLRITLCSITNNTCGGGGNGASGSDAENANSPNGFPGGAGGTGGLGAGIFNVGSVILLDSKIEGNVGGAGGNGGHGGARNFVAGGDGNDGVGGLGGQGGSAGGCYNGGTLILSGTQVRRNAGGAGGVGGVAYGNGTTGSSGTSGNGGDAGGIYSHGTLALTNCSISANATGAGGNAAEAYGHSGRGGRSGNGGGILILNSTANLVGSTLSGNRTGSAGMGGGGFTLDDRGGNGGWSGVGGAIYNGGALTLIMCTIAGNATGNGGKGGDSPSGAGMGGAAGAGGAIYNSSALTLIACTVSANRTGDGGAGGNTDRWRAGDGGDGGNGGGVFNAAAAGFASLRNCLIAYNTNGVAGAGGVSSGLLAGTNGAPGVAGNSPDLGGAFESQGHNFVGKRDGASFVPAIQPTDWIPAPGFSQNPLLGPLADNGGPTLTMAPLPGSRAIGNGDDSIAGLLATDQRGYLRSSGGHVDIGAFEEQVADPSKPPQIESIRVEADHTLTLSFRNNPGLQFQVLGSTNVALPLSQWLRLGTATQLWAGQYQFTDPSAPNHPHRFYQVVWP